MQYDENNNYNILIQISTVVIEYKALKGIHSAHHYHGDRVHIIYDLKYLSFEAFAMYDKS